jgi:enoyl-CoA hydratase/carnithine racemase
MAEIRDLIRMKLEGRVAHIRIDNPPMNTISTEILQELARLVAECGSDDTVRAILLDTAGDKPPFAADGAALLSDLSWESQFAMVRDGQRALTAIEFSSKPVVMAIYDGICMGGGLELALSCHIRVAGRGVLFSVPEAPAGAMPGWGNTQRLVHYFGRSKAIELVLTGSQITALEAQALGAVNHVVPGAEVLSKAREIANGIARMRTKSIRATMAAIHVPYRDSVTAGKATELEQYMSIYDPKTFAAAVKALFEQRTIEFTD